MRARAPAVAGMFYSDKPQELAANVRSFVAAASSTPPAKAPKAIVAPHAGYIYSGPVAGSAYAALALRGAEVERVILVGPSHRVAFSGLATSGAAVFETPLGPMHVDREAVAQLTSKHLAREFESPHQNEHSLEVQLPFLKQVCPDARIVPILSGDDGWQAMAQAIDLLWGGQETAVVVSSDLSHYHDYATAKSIDTATARALEKLAAGQVDFEQACGATAVNALLSVAASKDMACTTLDLRNSGDTAGPRDRVVGYGAFTVG
jgi:MEMO1 family protein